jgi:hypothetical protein
MATKTDEFLGRMERLLDGHCGEFKRSVMEQTARLLGERESEAIELVKQLRATLVQRDAAIAAATDLADRNAAAVELERRRARKVEAALALSLARQRTKQAAAACFAKWRRTARAMAMHDERSRATQRVCLSAWRRVSATARGGEFWRARTEAISLKLVDRYEAELEALRRQLREARDEAYRAQDELKRALVRGVCALNIEAISAIRPGARSSSSSSSLSPLSVPEPIPEPSTMRPTPTPLHPPHPPSQTPLRRS